MDRDMSYELDGIFANRNAGELVKVTTTKTRMTRSPGLASLGQRVAGPTTRRLNPPMSHPISHESPSPMQRATRATATIPHEAWKPATGLADAYSPMDGLGLTVPGLGTISWAQLAVGATVGMVLGFLLRRPKR